MAEPSASGPRRRFLILHNARAGWNRIGLVREVVDLLEREGAVADVQDPTQIDGRAPAATRFGGYDAIIASGGDGTVRHLLADLRGLDVPLGLIPAGTGNVLAAELAIPRTAAGIARVLLGGRVAQLSAAAVNGYPFLLMCGAGYDGEVVARAPEHLKHRFGRMAFGWPIARALAARPRFFEATIDGRTREMSWLIVANASRYAGRFVLSRHTGVLAPGFSVVMSRALDRYQRIAEVLALMAGRIEQCPTIEVAPATVVEINAARSLPVQVDGDAYSAPSIRLEASVSSVPMLVP